MANENGQERRETLADIVSEIRAYGAQPPPRLMWLEIADRIEAAAKLEKSEIESDALTVGGIVEAERHKPGNAAAMREALKTIHDKVNSLDEECGVDPVEIRDIARAALSKPARNCDVYKTSWDVVTHWDGGLDSAKSVVRMLDWLLSPAKSEKKGESNGR